MSEVADGWQLLVDGAEDPDPDRRADLLRAYRRLPFDERLTLVARGRGGTYAYIAKLIKGKEHRMVGKRLVDQALAHLRREVNG